MNCQNFQEMLQPFIDGELKADALLKMREHILSCSACRSGLSDADLMEILPAVDRSIRPSEDFSSRFYTKLQARQSDDRQIRVRAYGWRPSWMSGWVLRLAAACVLVVCITAGLYFRPVSSPPDTSAVMYDIEVTENLSLLKDMALLEDLELFEDFDVIESLPQQ